MDLRSTVVALWLWCLLLHSPSCHAEPTALPIACADEERLELPSDPLRRGALAVLLCPDEAAGRRAREPTGVSRLLMGQAIDLDLATEEELQALPGIGPGYARRIIADREARGPFGSLDGLKRVKGFGDKRVGKLEGWAVASESGEKVGLRSRAIGALK